MAASKQIDLIFNALSHAIVTTVKPSWLNVFCGEVGRLIGQCVNKRAAAEKGQPAGAPSPAVTMTRLYTKPPRMLHVDLAPLDSSSWLRLRSAATSKQILPPRPPQAIRSIHATRCRADTPSLPICAVIRTRRKRHALAIVCAFHRAFAGTPGGGRQSEVLASPRSRAPPLAPLMSRRSRPRRRRPPLNSPTLFAMTGA